MKIDDYEHLTKWKGKIFTQDERTCFNDGWQYGYETGLLVDIAQLEKAIAIIKIAREALIRDGLVTGNSERIYKEEAERLCALFFEKADEFLKEQEVKCEICAHWRSSSCWVCDEHSLFIREN